jgi:hypothetical protein
VLKKEREKRERERERERESERADGGKVEKREKAWHVPRGINCRTLLSNTGLCFSAKSSWI